MMNAYAVQVENGKEGVNDEPSVGPVYRSILAKDGFPPPDSNMSTSWEVFRNAAEKYPGNKMLGWRKFTNEKAGHYLWKTYKEIYEEVLNVGSALQRLGARSGSRIGIYGVNCPQWVVAMEACNGYSLICVPLYDTLGAGAVDYIIEHAEIEFVFVQDKKVKQVRSLILLHALCFIFPCLVFAYMYPICSCCPLIAVLSGNSKSSNAAKIGIKVYSWDEFLHMGKENPCDPYPPRPLDICTIMYTSGASGNPKGVILTHENHATCIKGVDLFLGQFEDKMTVDDVYLSFLPLAHIIDRVIEEYFFHKGASVGYYQGDINALRDDLMELKPTVFAGVPRVFERIHEGVLKALQELRPLRRMIFNILYNYKLFWMRSGYKHKNASPLADFLAFHKVHAQLGGKVRLLISGGAPLNTKIEEFLKVTSCAFFTQAYGGLLTSLFFSF
ncbi:putative long-chain-fatty-acid--CoA ligase [Dioscorea sansibarensis]